jgi:hypothetical protein
MWVDNIKIGLIQDKMVWTGLIGLRIGTSGELLFSSCWDFSCWLSCYQLLQMKLPSVYNFTYNKTFFRYEVLNFITFCGKRSLRSFVFLKSFNGGYLPHSYVSWQIVWQICFPIKFSHIIFMEITFRTWNYAEFYSRKYTVTRRSVEWL